MRINKWQDHYPDEIPVSIDYDEVPLHQFLEQSAKRYPERKAIHFMGKEMTYNELYFEAKKMAFYLQSIGVEKGDRVAIMLPNCPQAIIAYYGIMMAGGIVVQTNPLYKERELEYQLNDAGVKVIICLDILVPLVTKVIPRTELTHIIVACIKDYLPFPKNIIYPFIQKKQYNIVVKVKQSSYMHVWNNIMDGPSKHIEIDIEPTEDLALLQYTGGTTGPPKGVKLTRYNLVANVQMCEAWLYKTKEKPQVILGVLPFFHVYGMTTVMNLSVMQASKIILLPKFNLDDVLKAITKQKPTLFPGAPTIYISIINHPDLHKYDLSSIEACISGSAPLPVEVQEQFEKITGGKLVEGYGLTEASPVTHANLIWGKRITGSVGIPWPDTDAKIVKTIDGIEQEAEIGEVGEIALKGPQIMKGYWNKPDETAAVLRDDWLFTGDLGYMDENGYFYIVDRKKDVIIAGGFNVYPREVEEVLYEHEAVQEVAVIGVPDDYRGETVKAYIVLKEGYSPNENELSEHCRKHLATFKVPRIYEFRNELPKTTIGKILKRNLIEEEREKQDK